MTGARIVWECLTREGVGTVFGYPGGAVLNLYDALLDFPAIHHVLARHEQGACHMADGYARASGQVGVVIATSGPGATNLVTGLATAMLDSVPLVAITGQVRSHLIGTRRLPGSGRHRRHHPHHQAQLPGARASRTSSRCSGRPLPWPPPAGLAPSWWTSPPMPRRLRPSFDWDDCVPHRHLRHLPPRPDAEQIRAGPQAHPERQAAGHPRGPGHRSLGGPAGGPGLRGEDLHPHRRHPAGPGRHPRQPPPEPRHDGHARRGLDQPDHPGGRSPAGLRHALRRPGHGGPQDLRPPRQEDPHRDRCLRDPQEREGGRADPGRPAGDPAGAAAPGEGQGPLGLAGARGLPAGLRQCGGHSGGPRAPCTPPR